MTPQLLRLALVLEFLLSLIAVFTAWSEIGGQSVLDLIHWGWKLGLSLSLAASTVGYTAAIVGEERIWTLRSARWLTALLISVIATIAVTSVVALQADFIDMEEGSTTSALPTNLFASWQPA